MPTAVDQHQESVLRAIREGELTSGYAVLKVLKGWGIKRNGGGERQAALDSGLISGGGKVPYQVELTEMDEMLAEAE